MGLNLSPGEQVIFQGHPSWRAILGFYLKGIAVAAVAGLLAKLFGADDGAVFLTVLAVVGLTVVAGFVKRVATTYTITDRRLNIKRGIISREVQETRLERVQNVNYEQSVYQRLVQVGDVDFDTAGSGDYSFSFDGVAEPVDVVEKVDEAMRIHSAEEHGLGDPAPSTAIQPPQRVPPSGGTPPP
jgi:uncharacterized membrane protein YdbT with pleckstrin-like domain